MLDRRGFLGGLVAAFAAPAIVHATNIMSIKAPGLLLPGRYDVSPSGLSPVCSKNQLLAINQITREAVRLFRNSNKFIQAIDREYEKDFAFAEGDQWNGYRIGSTLRIRLPSDFKIAGDHWMTFHDFPDTEGVAKRLLEKGLKS